MYRVFIREKQKLEKRVKAPGDLREFQAVGKNRPPTNFGAALQTSYRVGEITRNEHRQQRCRRNCRIPSLDLWTYEAEEAQHSDQVVRRPSFTSVELGWEGAHGQAKTAPGLGCFLGVVALSGGPSRDSQRRGG